MFLPDLKLKDSVMSIKITIFINFKQYSILCHISLLKLVSISQSVPFPRKFSCLRTPLSTMVTCLHSQCFPQLNQSP